MGSNAKRPRGGRSREGFGNDGQLIHDLRRNGDQQLGIEAPHLLEARRELSVLPFELGFQAFQVGHAHPIGARLDQLRKIDPGRAKLLP